MRIRATLTLAFVFLFVITGCGGEDKPATTSPPASAPANVSSLDGKTYVSTSVTGRTLVPDTRVTATFTDGVLSLNAGCNTLGGAYRVDQEQLVAAQLGGTEMGCDTPRHEQDAWLAQLFSSKPALSIADDTITVTSATASLTLRDRAVVRPDKPLVGTTWIVDTIINGETAASAPAGVMATILLPNETRIEVYDGCNRTSGAVDVGASSLTLVDLPAPVRANCRVASALDYAAVLEGRVDFEIDGDRLTLTGPAGAGFGLHAR